MNRLLLSAPLIRQTCARRLSTSEARNSLEKIRAKQAHFQEDNDIPVYLKGGAGDQVLVATVLGMTAVGIGLSVQALYQLTSKK